MHKALLTKLAIPACVALGIATIWAYLARDMYQYDVWIGGFAIMGLNLFPLIGWTIALILGYFVVQYILKKIGIETVWVQMLCVIGFYIVAVLIVETAGYHLAGIHNIGTSQYAGIPLCDCLHAPGWMQGSYFFLGPIHWLATNIFTLRTSPAAVIHRSRSA